MSTKTPLFRIRPAAMVLLVLFFGMTLAVSLGATFVNDLNLAVANLAYSLRTPGRTSFWTGVTLFGEAPVVIVMTAVTAGILVWKKRYKDALFILVSVAVIAAFCQLFKMVVAYPRPHISKELVTAWGNSYPSGHTCAAISYFGSLALVIIHGVKQKWVHWVAGILAVAAAVLVGISRLYLGVHWTTDIIGSFLLGGALLIEIYDMRKRMTGPLIAGDAEKN